MDKQSVNSAFAVDRVIPVAQVPQDKLEAAVHVLCQQNAVIDALVDKRGRLRVAYDASRIGMHDIEVLLDGVGIARDTSFWSRVKLSWFRMTDDNARDNAHAGSGACCNRPPPVPHNLGSKKKHHHG